MSEGIVDFDSPKYLYVSITDFTNSGTNNFIATFADSVVSTDIIARIDYVHQIDKKIIIILLEMIRCVTQLEIILDQ